MADPTVPFKIDLQLPQTPDATQQPLYRELLRIYEALRLLAQHQEDEYNRHRTYDDL